ncbi:MAG: ATP-binding cassette domain-containing protein [Anaerolineales bacterium]|nr:ATP-binding cassette domain-containing protein [Anaerolineales bacterium]
MSTEPILIETEDLHHAYPGADGIEALRGVDLKIQAGEWVAIVGANGSGKTTLARHLNALLLPTGGSVRVAGMDTKARAFWPEIRSRVGMVFQRPEDQIVATTIEDDVAFGPQNLGLSGDDIKMRVRQALETVDMWQHRRRPPHFLSAGQQQRVAIAGALAMRPQCLVMDEATAMLDPSGRQAISHLVSSLHDQGIAIISITHRMREASVAQRIIALSNGLVAFDGTPRSLFSDPQLVESLGLSLPPVVALGAELARHWPGFPTGLMTADELVGALKSMSYSQHDEERTLPASRSDTEPYKNGATTLATVTDLSHTYMAGTPFSTRSLDGVSLTVSAGEVVVLLGPTGSGKSTLMQLIAGLLQSEAGNVSVDTDQMPSNGYRTVGMLFQRSEEQLFETFVGDDVAYGPRQLGLSQEDVRERVRWAMETANLSFEGFKDRFTQGLSGGEQRKVALAGVLALKPRLLLLDEPTAGLDPHTRTELLDTLRRLNKEEGVTLVIATHALEDVIGLADRAIVLDGGRMAIRGSLRQVFTNAIQLCEHGLELPEITDCMHRLAAAGYNVPVNVLTVGEAIQAVSSLFGRA